MDLNHLSVISTLRQYDALSSDLVELGVSFSFSPSNGQGHDSIEMRSLLSQHQIAVIGDDSVDRKVLESCPELRLIVRWGAGTDNVDLVAARELGIPVVNTPGLFGADVADLALALALCCVRTIVKTDRQIREGYWPKGTTSSFRSLTAAILGVGAVGREVARLLSTFGLKIKVFDPTEPPGVTETWTAFATVEECVAGANLLFACLPLTAETRGVVNRGLMESMGAPAFVINVSRGEVLDQFDLFTLIDERKIDGAGLDVFQIEPLQLEALPQQAGNLVLSSHNASNTFQSIARANSKVDSLIRSFVLEEMD